MIETFGRLDILVNNAGRSQRARWEHTDIKVFISHLINSPYIGIIDADVHILQKKTYKESSKKTDILRSAWP